MALISTGWSINIVGKWNQAILTPQGIARRVFGLDEGVPIEVRIAVDSIGTYQVVHQDVIVSVLHDRLILGLQQCDWNSLAQAMKLGAQAVDQLPPETPFSAVGINVNFNSQETYDYLDELLASEMDNALTDLGYKIVTRSLNRSTEWAEGLSNLSVSLDSENNPEIKFNFHLQTSKKQEITNWLSKDTNELKKHVANILNNCLDIDF